MLSFPLVCELAHIKGTKRGILLKDVLTSISNFSIRTEESNIPLALKESTQLWPVSVLCTHGLFKQKWQ